MAKMDVQHDVIVIGAGIAGLVAANRAAQLGKRVIVLEKSREEKYLCNSRYTYGTFHINFTDVGADEDVLLGKIEACSEGHARKDLARAVAKDGRRLMQWLKSEGIDLVDLGGYQTNVLAPPWREGFGLTWRGYAGDVALARLEANLRRRQGRMLRGTRACALTLAAGAIEVATDEAAGAAKFNAASVVIADGGFQASFDMIRTHIACAPEKLLARNGGTATGDGLRMAQAVGAASTGLDMFYGHLHSRDAMNTDRLWPRPYADEIAAASIVIDADGRRFADEGLGGRTARPRPCAAAQSAVAGGGRHAASRRHDRGAGRTHRHRAAAAGGACRRVQRRRRRRHAAYAVAAAPRRPLQGLADQDRAVLCHADLRGHHQHHGWHRGRRQRRRPRPQRHADSGPVRGRLHRRGVGRRTERRLRRRTDQGNDRVACRGNDRGVLDQPAASKRAFGLQSQGNLCYKGCAPRIIPEKLPAASVQSGTLQAARTGHDNDQGGRR
jgi:FAD binding domain